MVWLATSRSDPRFISPKSANDCSAPAARPSTAQRAIFVNALGAKTQLVASQTIASYWLRRSMRAIRRSR